MMPWVLSSQFPPPQDRVISVRFGGSILFAGYFPWQKKWFWLIPGGSSQEIADPPIWFCHEPVISDEEEREVLATCFAISPGLRARRGQQSLALEFPPDDSQKLSRTRAGASNR